VSPGRIYIDIDDVLGLTSASLLELLDEHHGKRLDYEDLAHFDLEISFGLNSEEVHDLLVRAHEPDVLAVIEPVPGCREVLARWLDAGYEVDLLTGRPPLCDDSTRRWLDAHDFAYSNLFFVDKYDRADRFDPAGHAISLEEMREMDFVLAVEDSPQVAIFLAETMGVEVALMDRPWNRDVTRLGSKARRRIQRCLSWDEIAKRYAAP
jgi:uncharacterized HAD superfamily protein